MFFNENTKKYWNEEEIKLLNNVESLPEMYDIAVNIIEKMPKPIIQVCGPITTGGVGNVSGNLKELNNKIFELQNNGLSIFDQSVFEDTTQKLTEKLSKNEYFADVLTEFYLPLFEKGYIEELYFLPDWQTSKGATWEHEQAKRLGLKIVYI